MTTLADEAAALAAEVAAEREKPLSERETRASDGDLERAAAILHAAMRPDLHDNVGALRGHFGLLVTDRWSFDSSLSARRCEFDDRLGHRR